MEHLHLPTFIRVQRILDNASSLPVMFHESEHNPSDLSAETKVVSVFSTFLIQQPKRRTSKLLLLLQWI